ncbi:MAG: type II toxin-antitoxin system RelE/ParE family toxin [Weeksellaceae bacterium]|jgi:plasmid stabilization system protein ParE|nr:type II toxin-antitoxin system RelE/ParE family toxin [Weeksellaceae bacterium]
MKIEFLDEAYLDIEDAILWYESVRKGLSVDFQLCLENALDEIIEHPDSFQKRYNFVRIKFIKRFPYGIHYYAFDESTLRIIGVIHVSRSPKIWSERLKSN